MMQSNAGSNAIIEDKLDTVNSCYYCQGQEFTAKYTDVKDRLHQSYHRWNFMQCARCQAAILNPRPKSEDLGKFYPKHYTFIANDASSGLMRKWFSNLEYLFHFRHIYLAQAKIALRLSGKKVGRGIRILDIGCGSGLLLKEFRRLGCEVEGVDMREDVVNNLIMKLDISAKQLDVAMLSSVYPPASFDMITMVHLLEHVIEPNQLLEQCLSILKPGGALIIIVPLVDSLQIKLFGGSATSVTEAPRHVSIPAQRSMYHLSKHPKVKHMRWQADSLLQCASGYGLSLFPEGALTQQHGTRKLIPLVKRALAALITYASIPLVLIENKVLRKPAAGMFAFTKADE